MFAVHFAHRLQVPRLRALLARTAAAASPGLCATTATFGGGLVTILSELDAGSERVERVWWDRVS